MTLTMTPGRASPSRTCYFDGRPHLDPGQAREDLAVPRTVYPGSVARLFAEWKVLPQGRR